MDRKSEESAEARFAAYVEGLAGVIGHADRIGPLRDYCTGLMLPGERKSVEPMAARRLRRGRRRSTSRCCILSVCVLVGRGGVGQGARDGAASIEQQGPIEAWIIDDTAFPKQGKHSVGVHHQYCGQLGKEANCQVAVSLSIANHSASLPVAYRLYLPKEWAKDSARRNKAGVPPDIGFKTKPEIALEQIRWACEAGLPRGVALMDAAYGNDSRLRTGMTALGVSYVVGIQPKILVWPPGTGPRRSGKPLNNTGRRDEPDLISAKRLARDLPKDAWQTIRWREGSADWLSSRFARVRVRVGHSQLAGTAVAGVVADRVARRRSRADQILALDAASRISFRELVDFAKLRWRIERDYQELKQEVGLGHFEGRGWRGFHHHATLCIAAYGFLIAERATIPPSGPRSATPFQTPALPEGYRPRGSALAA